MRSQVLTSRYDALVHKLALDSQQAALHRGTRIWNDQSHKSYRPLTVLAFRFQRILGARVFDSERAPQLVKHPFAAHNVGEAACLQKAHLARRRAA